MILNRLRLQKQKQKRIKEFKYLASWNGVKRSMFDRNVNEEKATNTRVLGGSNLAKG